MTNPPPIPQDDDDLLAAEYAMGLLDGPDWTAAQMRADTDAAFAARVRAWEERLAPLNAGYGEAPPPPQVWDAVAARIAPPARTPFRGWQWLAGLASGTATVAALVVGLAVLAPPRSPLPVPALQAELVAPETGLTLRARADAGAATLALVLDGPAAGPGQDYELWVIVGDSAPRSLGVVRAGASVVPVAVQAGQTLALSLEPAGGAPAGAPTGPVLAAAVLTDA